MSRQCSEKLFKALTGDRKRRGWDEEDSKRDGKVGETQSCIRWSRDTESRGVVPVHKRPRLTQPLFLSGTSPLCLQTPGWRADDNKSSCQTGWLFQATSSFSGVRDRKLHCSCLRFAGGSRLQVNDRFTPPDGALGLRSPALDGAKLCYFYPDLGTREIGR